MLCPVAIKSGTYKSQVGNWVNGLDINNAQDSATDWATESNAAVCTTVLKRGVSYVETTDLGGAYTDAASPVVKLQVAKQGYRCVFLLCCAPGYDVVCPPEVTDSTCVGLPSGWTL